MSKILTIITIVKDDFYGFEKTFNSISLELIPEVEFLIVDSSQNTEIKNFLTHSRINDFSYFFQEPKGIYPAMNFGLNQSRGKWIWFLNAGDTKYQSTTLPEIIQLLESSEKLSAVIFSVNHVVSENLVWSKTVPMINLISGSQVIDCNHQGFIARKSAILESGGFDTTFKYAADSKLMDMITKNGDFLLDNRAVANFQIGGTSSVNFREVLKEIARHRRQQDYSGYSDSLNKAVFKNHLRMYFLRIVHFLPKTIRPTVLRIRNLFRAQ